ncbi:MAG: hypothetical protein R3A48_00990 [Polyangiales bacterium]
MTRTSPSVPSTRTARWDVVGAQDNAYLSWHRGDGVTFDANPMFRMRRKVQGVRFLHDYALARQGYADDEEAANQAHFTNSAPAIADLDGDGRNEIVVVGSVQNAAQSDRTRGVALWVLQPDASRAAGWEEPLHVPATSPACATSTGPTSSDSPTSPPSPRSTRRPLAWRWSSRASTAPCTSRPPRAPCDGASSTPPPPTCSPRASPWPTSRETACPR